MKLKKKRLISLLLALVIAAGLLPVNMAAAESAALCEHHQKHDESCGYAEAVIGSECGHMHDELCGYSEGSAEQLCQCQPSEDGVISHEDNCGYLPAAESRECTHEHDEACGYVKAVEAAACTFICENCNQAEPEKDKQNENQPEPYADGDLGTGTPDGTPPVLNSVSFSSNTVTVNSSVEVIVDASDDVSGVRYGTITLYCESTQKTLGAELNSTYYDSGEEIQYPDGKLHGTLEIDQYVEAGTFVIEYIDIIDTAGNSAYYNDFNNMLPDNVRSLTLEVIEAATPDSTAPVLNSISFSSDTVTAPGSVEVIVDASDDVSGVRYGIITLHCENTQKMLGAELYSSYYEDGEEVPYPNGKLHGTLEIDQYVKAGIFAIEYIEIVDVAGNSAYYDDFNNILPESVKSLSLEVVESTTPDNTAPVLNSVSFSSTTVTAPGSVEMTVDASDDVSGVRYGIITLRCENTQKMLGAELYSSYYEDGEEIPYPDGKLHGTLEIDQYVETGTFIIEYIDLIDVAGNSALYNDYNQPLPDSVKSITLQIRNTGADVTTSLSKENFVETVQNAGNDDYIAADYSGNATMPKAAFDALVGTDKTLELISEGITWRFEGSDITETTKDIELNVEIKPIEQDSSASGEAIEDKLDETPAVLMKFPENGTLPGKATIQVKVDYAMRKYLGNGGKLCVYYYNNQSGQLELIASNLSVIGDSYVEFPITHCSCYILTHDLSKPAYTVDMDLAEGTVVYIDGIARVLGAEGKVQLSNGKAKSLVAYSMHTGKTGDPHTKYPTGMKVWFLNYDPVAREYNVKRAEALDNIMQYAGSSIRITGKKGIRMITGVPQNVRSKLMDGGIEGYTLLEYGTAVAWASELGAQDLTLSFPGVKSNYAFRKGLSDPIFAQSNGLIQYTNVLVGFTNEQCVPDLVMRSYMKLQNKDGEIVTIYGGAVQRSIGYIAWQIRNSFTPGSEAYEYIWGIIRHVYGDTYDSEYRG